MLNFHLLCPADAQHLTAPPPAMQQVLDNLGSLPNATGAAELDLIFLRGIMESPIVRSLAKVWCIREVGRGNPRNGARDGRSHLKGCGRRSCLGDLRVQVDELPWHLAAPCCTWLHLAACGCTWLVRGGKGEHLTERRACLGVGISRLVLPTSLLLCVCACVPGGRQTQEKRKL